MQEAHQSMDDYWLFHRAGDAEIKRAVGPARQRDSHIVFVITQTLPHTVLLDRTRHSPFHVVTFSEPSAHSINEACVTIN